MDHRQKLEDLMNEIASTPATKLSAGLRDRWASELEYICTNMEKDKRRKQELDDLQRNRRIERDNARMRAERRNRPRR